MGLPDALHRLGLTEPAVSEQLSSSPVPNTAAFSLDTHSRVGPALCDTSNHVSGAAVNAALVDSRHQATTSLEASRSPRQAEQGNGESISGDAHHGENQDENQQHAGDSRASHRQNDLLIRVPFQELQEGAISSTGKPGKLPGNSLTSLCGTGIISLQRPSAATCKAHVTTEVQAVKL